MTRKNFIYMIIGALLAGAIGLGIYTYQEQKEPEGVQLSIGEQGVKLEAN
jgi:hypothetical protein